MFKHMMKVSVVLGLAFTVACAKKVKPDEAAGLGAGGEGAAISQEAMTYNAAGSDSGQINGLSTVNFPYDSSTLDSHARELLKGNADWIKTNSKVTVQIEGHCDSRGSVEYNLALGERRAKAVKEYLASLGVDNKRMTIISFGKEKPLEVGDTEAIYAKNRRANFVPLSN